VNGTIRASATPKSKKSKSYRQLKDNF